MLQPVLSTVERSADWLVIFDTEFSQSLNLKVRSTTQIPVSGMYVCRSQRSVCGVGVRVVRALDSGSFSVPQPATPKHPAETLSGRALG